MRTSRLKTDKHGWRGALVLALVLGTASARDLHVDPTLGDDRADGMAQPVKTIARGLRVAQPGDTIHLERATYHESAEFGRKSGEADRPITLDGHGSTLDGSERVLARDWEQVEPNLFKKVKLLPKVDDFMIQRWFMVWDGVMKHMGRTSKGHLDPLKKPADLLADEWTYVKDEDAFYVRLAPGRDLEQANILYPARSSGVAIGGASHLRVRNLTCTHVFNDGFNVHGSARDCVFTDIAAIECGDDGFSAHEDAECEIDGFHSDRNSTGFTDINASKTHYRRVKVQGCLAFAFLFQGNGEHSVRDGFITSDSATPLGVSAGGAPESEPCRLTLENVICQCLSQPFQARFPAQTEVELKHCTLWGFLPLVSKGALTLTDCEVMEKGPVQPSSAKGADYLRLQEMGLFSKEP